MTQKDNIFDDMPVDDPVDGPANGNGAGNGNGHGPASDTGPTGPFTALSSAELAAVTIEDDEDLEDLSAEVENSEDSVRARMPGAPPASGAATMAPTSIPSLEAAAAELDWGMEEAATRAAAGHELPLAPMPASDHSPTSLGMPAPPLADAFTVQPGAQAPAPEVDAMSLQSFALAPTLGMPSTVPPAPAPTAAPPVVSPFVLVADVESGVPVPPPIVAPPPMPVQPWGIPVGGSSGSVLPFHAPTPLPIVEDPMPVTRAMPEAAPQFMPLLSPVEDDFPLPAPRRSSAGTVIGVFAGILIAGVIAAGVWWFQLREKTGTLILRAPQDATVTVDGAPASGVSGLFIVRDLGVGAHSVVVIRPGAAPWADAVQIAGGDSLQIEAPGARGGDTGTPVASAPIPMPSPIPPSALASTGTSPSTPTSTSTSTSTTTTPTPAPHPLPATPHSMPATPHPTPATGSGPASRTTEPAARGGSGFLSVNTVPWAAVEVDGHSVGNTPVLRHELRAGDHRVTLIVQAWNIRQTRRIVVQAGETTTVTVRFQEPGTQSAPQGSGPMGPGPTGPRPMGPGTGPMGPRPMGPGPMGPRPMGPGPMGGPPRN